MVAQAGYGYGSLKEMDAFAKFNAVSMGRKGLWLQLLTPCQCRGSPFLSLSPLCLAGIPQISRKASQTID